MIGLWTRVYQHYEGFDNPGGINLQSQDKDGIKSLVLETKCSDSCSANQTEISPRLQSHFPLSLHANTCTKNYFQSCAFSALFMSQDICTMLFTSLKFCF